MIAILSVWINAVMNKMVSTNAKRNRVRWILISGFTVLIAFGLGSLISRRESTRAPAQTGLIAWWPGDSNGDDIIGTNNGIVPDSVTFAEGKVGMAFSF